MAQAKMSGSRSILDGERSAATGRIPRRPAAPTSAAKPDIAPYSRSRIIESSLRYLSDITLKARPSIEPIAGRCCHAPTSGQSATLSAHAMRSGEVQRLACRPARAPSMFSSRSSTNSASAGGHAKAIEGQLEDLGVGFRAADLVRDDDRVELRAERALALDDRHASPARRSTGHGRAHAGRPLLLGERPHLFAIASPRPTSSAIEPLDVVGLPVRRVRVRQDAAASTRVAGIPRS